MRGRFGKGEESFRASMRFSPCSRMARLAVLSRRCESYLRGRFGRWAMPSMRQGRTRWQKKRASSQPVRGCLAGAGRGAGTGAVYRLRKDAGFLASRVVRRIMRSFHALASALPCMLRATCLNGLARHGHRSGSFLNLSLKRSRAALGYITPMVGFRENEGLACGPGLV